jgi:subtilisin family serine protease
MTGDPFGHGTNVATLIAANPQRSEGTFGVAPGARILPLRVGTANGRVLDRAAAAALAYATANPRVRVINMSWANDYSRLLADALRAVARKRSVLLVAAAGNDLSELSESRFLPQSFDSPSELTVASSNLLSGLSFFSNYGRHVEVAAPGEQILSAFPGDTLKLADGTSMAAPIVSGVAALLFSRYPEATAAQVKGAIVASCTPAPALAERVDCGGIVNAPRALETLAGMLGATPQSTT